MKTKILITMLLCFLTIIAVFGQKTLSGTFKTEDTFTAEVFHFDKNHKFKYFMVGDAGPANVGKGVYEINHDTLIVRFGKEGYYGKNYSIESNPNADRNMLEIEVTDIHNNLKLPAINCFLQRSKITAITNDEGKAKIPVTNLVDTTDTLVISFIGYGDTKVPLKELVESRLVRVRLGHELYPEETRIYVINRTWPTLVMTLGYRKFKFYRTSRSIFDNIFTKTFP